MLVRKPMNRRFKERGMRNIMWVVMAFASLATFSNIAQSDWETAAWSFNSTLLALNILLMEQP